MEEEDLSGAMEKSTMESGKTVERKVVVCGRDRVMSAMLENGTAIQFKVSVCFQRKAVVMKVNSSRL